MRCRSCHSSNGTSATAMTSAAVTGRKNSAPDLSANGVANATPAPTSSVSAARSEEHTSELQSLMRISYAVFCLKKKNNTDAYETMNPDQSPHSYIDYQHADNNLLRRQSSINAY